MLLSVGDLAAVPLPAEAARCWRPWPGWQHRRMPTPRVTVKTKIFEIEIEIVVEQVQPQVRRRVQVPGEASLAVLHEVVQTVVGWTNSHLHEFEIDGRRYGIPDRDWDDRTVTDEAKGTLFRLVRLGAGSATSTTSATTGRISSPWRTSCLRNRVCATRAVSQARGRAHRRTSVAHPLMDLPARQLNTRAHQSATPTPATRRKTADRRSTGAGLQPSRRAVPDVPAA